MNIEDRVTAYVSWRGGSNYPSCRHGAKESELEGARLRVLARTLEATATQRGRVLVMPTLKVEEKRGPSMGGQATISLVASAMTAAIPPAIHVVDGDTTWCSLPVAALPFGCVLRGPERPPPRPGHASVRVCHTCYPDAWRDEAWGSTAWRNQ